MRKTRSSQDVLLAEEVDELDLSVLAKVALELVLVEDFKVLHVADVDVASRTGVDGHSESGGDGTWVLAPSDLETTVVQDETLERGDLVKRESGTGVDKRDELRPIENQPRSKANKSRRLTAICLSCMYRTLCNIPPRIALHRSSVDVSG